MRTAANMKPSELQIASSNSPLGLPLTEFVSAAVYARLPFNE